MPGCLSSFRIVKLVVMNAHNCLEAIEEFPLYSGRSRRGETEWSREVGGETGLSDLVYHLHQYLELIRRALSITCKPQWYYLQETNGGLTLSLYKPGLRLHVESVISIILIYDKHVDLSCLARIL